MFNWALAGLYRLTQQAEFTKSTAADAAKDEYKDETNPVRQFFDIAIEPDSSSSITAEKFYWAYQQWCYQYGYKPMSASVFGREIRRHFPMTSRVRAKDAYGMRFYRYENLKFVISKVNGKNIFESDGEY
jgi:phage/plasmid-associated DNA primase